MMASDVPPIFNIAICTVSGPVSWNFPSATTVESIGDLSSLTSITFVPSCPMAVPVML